MPLLDHFNPPLNRTHPLRSFHGAWAAAMARMLNQGVLPSGYYAVPLVDRGGPVEIDVAALRETGPAGPAGGTAWSQTWVMCGSLRDHALRRLVTDSDTLT